MRSTPVPKTHPANRKRGAAGPALLRNHDAFKCLNAFLHLLAFAFKQADVHLDGVASAKLGKVFAQLRFMQLTPNGFISLFPCRPTQAGHAHQRQTVIIAAIPLKCLAVF